MMSATYGATSGAINCINSHKNSSHLSFCRFPKDPERRRMSLYLDTKVQSPEAGCINISLEWHQQYPLLAVASYSQEKGGFVTIYDDLGEPLPDVSWPQHSVAQVTALAWHPTKKLLVIGWENGELHSWAGDSEFVSLQSVHQTPITILQWSSQGGRLVSGDTAGSLVGSKVDTRGQILAMFHHELKTALTHIVFRCNPKQVAQGLDISGLARAAVAGDEKALDMFSAWRPRTAGHRMVQTGHGDNFCFYVGAVSGSLYYFTDEGTCTEVLNTEGTMLKKILYHEYKDNLIVMTEDLNIGQFQVHADGQLTELMKVKLNGRPQDAAIVWAGPGVLAVTTGDLMIRCWDLNTGESYLLEGADDTTASGAASNMPTEIFTSLSYCPQKKILSGGTNLGNILMWRSIATQNSGRESPSSGPSGGDPAQNWQPEPPCSVRGAVKQLGWGDAHMLLAVNTITMVFILHEHELQAHYNNMIAALQQSANQLLVELELKEDRGKYHSLELTTDIQVKGIAAAGNHVAVWSSKTLVVYQLIVDGVGDDARITSKVIGSFPCEVETAFLHDQSVLVMLKDDSAVEVRTLQGTIKQSLLTSDVEGKPIGMQLCGAFLTVITAAGYIKIWDLSRREAKLHTNPKNVEEVVDDFGEIILATSNCSGTKVSISIAKSNFLPDPKLFVWDIESDSLQFYNLATGKLNENEDEDSDGLQADSLEENKSTPSPIADTGFNISGRFPLSHRWDEEESRLLVCEAKQIPKTASKISWPRRVSSSTVTIPTSDGNKTVAEVILVTFFTTPDSEELLLQDVTPLESETQLLAVHTPHFLLLRRPAQQQGSRLTARVLERLVMREFEGLQHCDKSTRDAVLNFSYNLRTGNMDEAFRAIKTVHSEAVWESLARMCVKTKRLDVAFVCLGHMKHVRGTMALREAMKEPELEARVGMLAVQLGLNAEAERLYASCGRWDLVNRLHQAAGEWEQALRIAEEHDRIHLRSTYFNYACHLEAKGDISGAAHMYEQAGVHTMQVPRMLLEDQRALEQYVLKSKDPQLVKWWGQYMESTGNMDAAMQYYEEAHDYFSLVRVLCFQENLARASEIASTTGDKAACYHLARQYEAMGNISEAVHFFTRAQAYGNAVRICKEQGMEDQLWNLALLAGPREQLEAARYFESSEKALPEKAVLLYHRAGMLHKALDLAFKSHQFSALQLIALDLTASSDPALVQKCARFFVENGEYEKAVDLLAVGKQYVEALALCVEHNIPVTEDLAEKLTINKGEGDEKTRIQVLEKVAESALAQGNYHLATKKFTQAGNKVAAMKALLKSGDTEKIIFFANVSRQREIYVMAANYLQSLDWQSQPDVLKNIVTFYSKGRAPELLANFYVACAQVEIDEYQNYEKALGALGEANRSLAKVSNPADPLQHKRAVENLNTRMTLVKRFVDIRRLADRGDRETAVTQCRQLLQQHDDLEAAGVRVGDVYGLMIEALIAAGDVHGAGTVLEEWRARVGAGVNLAYYLSASTMEKLGKELGLALLPRGSGSLQKQDKVLDEPEEEIEEVEESNAAAQ